METAMKRPLNGGEEDSEGRSKRQRTEVEADDAEVEAFFAILQRMRDAARCFGAARFDRNGRGRGEKGVWRWKPAFEWEDFQDPLPAVKHDGGRRSDTVFDLNAVPEPEPEPEPEGGEVTAGEHIFIC